MRWIPNEVLFLPFCLAASGVAAADDCNFRFQFRYSDGTDGCISSLPIAKETPSGRTSALEVVVPRTGLYSVVSTPHLQECAPIVTIENATWRSSGTAFSPTTETSQSRTKAAMSICQSALASLPNQGGSCICTLILVDGTSPMTPAELSTFLGSIRQ